MGRGRKGGGGRKEKEEWERRQVGRRAPGREMEEGKGGGREYRDEL
jgi:hypothetical protein